ncbi:siderophore-interacting protein [Kutzneria albida]|uniref:FAD-binding FR-type domain-containing protein n=1 Tax=Kutzneria albida DSM 43870 TaxID=1449976 RepID=W5W3W9_9PSEU|nr:siderophore-interacting protein [Kutzneria albida]AHH95485.1 hypothetical protein KALB_2116 [Kutzneria albida DSM 43870]
MKQFTLMRVTAVRRLTPHMARVTFGGLAEFEHLAPDQQAKLFFPRPGQGEPTVPQPPADGDIARWYQSYLAMPEAERPWMRSYSIRAHRPERHEIDIDFVLHGDTGPASAWASRAVPGDVLGLLGPAVSHYLEPSDEDWLLFLGDETALPAIGASLEALPAGTKTLAYIEVADSAEEQSFDTKADVTVHWVHRSTGRTLLDAARVAQLPEGTGFAWVAGEAAAVRALRRHLVDRGFDKKRIAFTGYWRAEVDQDAPPTAEDLADAQEALTLSQQ